MAIGLMGGTFNPIHVGHLLIGEYIREEWQLDKIIYIPAGNPPHKTGKEVIEARHRKKLVELAIKGNKNFQVSDVEISREGYSFTIDTIRQISIEYPYEKLFFLIGTDTMFELESWKKFKEIAKEIDFIIYGRGTHSKSEVERKIKFLSDNYGFRIHKSLGPELEISSTDIRKRLRNNLSVRYMIPDILIDEIRRKSLYKGD